MGAAKHVKTKDFLKAMKQTGATMRPGRNGHDVWYCPCGQHTLTVAANHVTIATTVVKTTATRMPCITLNI